MNFRRKYNLAGWIMIAGVTVASGAAGQTVPNSGFEEDTDSVSPGYRGAIQGWTIPVGSQCGTSLTSWPLNNNTRVPGGKYAGFIRSGSSISTVVSGLKAGCSYRITFYVNAGSGSSAPSGTLSLNGQAAAPFAFSAPAGGYYQRVQQDFVSTGTSAALVISNQNQQDSTLLLDDFSVALLSPEISIEEPPGNALSGVVAWGDDSYGQLTVPAGAQSGVTGLASGGGRIYAVKSDGSLLAWGNGADSLTNIPPEAQSGVKAVAARSDRTIVLKTDGRVFEWGTNAKGYIVQSGAASVAAGIAATMVLKEDGSLLAWYRPKSGWPDSAVALSPPAAPWPDPLRPASAIAIDDDSFFALMSDGRIITLNPRNDSQPHEVYPPRSDVGAISGRAALRTDGSVVLLSSNIPVPAVGQSGVTAVMGGQDSTAVLKSDGSVSAWRNSDGSLLPVPQAASSGITAVAAGSLSTIAALKNGLLPVDFGYQIAGSSPAVKTFTVKNSGQAPLLISEVTTTGENVADFQINTGGMINSIPAGGQTTFTVSFNPSASGTRKATLRVLNNDSNESVLDLGLTGEGASGTISVLDPAGTSMSPGNSVVNFVHGISEPAQPRTFTIQNTGNASLNIASVSLEEANSGFAVNTDGMLPAVPSGASTSFTVSYSPSTDARRHVRLRVRNSDFSKGDFQVLLTGIGLSPRMELEQPEGFPLAGVVDWSTDPSSPGGITVPSDAQSGIIAMAAGLRHSVALTSSGRVIGWGDTTVPPEAQSGVTAIAAGGNVTVAIKDGSPFMWTGAGQVSIPPMAARKDVTGVSLNQDEALLLRKDGSVMVWDTLMRDLKQPPVAAQSGVVSVASGLIHHLALKADGTVVAWGQTMKRSLPGPFGDTYVYSDVQLPENALVGAVAVGAAGATSLILKQDGSMFRWGYYDAQPYTQAGMDGVTAIATNEVMSYALKRDGTLLGLSGNFPSALAAQAGIRAITAGGNISGAGGKTHIMMLKEGLKTMDMGSSRLNLPGAPLTFTIRNTGSSALSITGVNLSGENAGDFSVNPDGIPGTVPVGGKTTFTVTFAPSAAGIRRAVLHVLNNDLASADYTLPLTGMGQITLPAWRQQWFGFLDNTGKGANEADPDGDGLPNLIEFAFGLPPLSGNAEGLPQPMILDNSVVYDFTDDGTHAGISYEAEWSATLAPDSWAPVADTGVAPRHVFIVPIGTEHAKFVRLKVTAP